MSNFDLAVNFVLENEGGISDNPHDRGGLTKFGISLRLLKSLDPETLKKASIYDLNICEETIKHLTIDQAKALYRLVFWDVAPFERINNQKICNYIFDMAINMGISPAIKCVQRAIWAHMKNKTILRDDGILGEKTLSHLNCIGAPLLSAIRSERAGDYRVIITAHPAQKANIAGWLNRAYNN